MRPIPRNVLILYIVSIIPLIVFGCHRNDAPAFSNAKAIERAGGEIVSLDSLEKMSRAEGHRVYVPVYSHIYHRDGDIFYLTNTLSIRNTDSEASMYVRSAKYFNTSGKLLREYADSPLRLPPMSTLEYIVGARDRIGGSGANFVVEWQSDRHITPPVIECVMISTGGQQGISFVTRGVNLD